MIKKYSDVNNHRFGLGIMMGIDRRFKTINIDIEIGMWCAGVDISYGKIK